MSKRMGWAVRTVVVVLLFALIFSWVTLVFLPDKGQTIIGFYREPKDSLDVLFVGSSPVRWGISPLTLWHEYGFTSYLRSSLQMQPSVGYNYLMEALETQSPKLVVMYVPKLFTENNVDAFEHRVRQAVDYMPFSRYKLDIIRETLAESETQTLWSYLFPLLRYHDRWKELSWEDLDIQGKLCRSPHTYRGQTPYYSITVYQKYDLSQWDESAAKKEVNAHSEEYLAKIAALLQEKGIPLLLVDMPRATPEYGRDLAYTELAERYQADYLNLAAPETMEAMGIDPTEDFYDATHLNATGAEKLSKYLGGYLTQRYDLPDRRGEGDMQRWDADYETWVSECKETRQDLAALRHYPEEAAADDDMGSGGKNE